MEICDYTEIPIDKGINDVVENNEISWKHFFRQLIISSGVWGCYLVFGMSVGAITVFVPQMRREANSTDAISPETVSWLAASFGYGGLPWVFILPALSGYFGRRFPFRLISIMAFVASIVFYFSTNIIHIFLSEIIVSAIAAGQTPVFVVIITEFSSPRYRGFFLTMKSASFAWGVWMSNAIGTFFQWRNIALVQIICSSYILITAIFSPESPFWLASRGRLEECRKAHRWLRGSNEKEKKELEHIIISEKSCSSYSVPLIKKTNFLTIITRRKIYKPVLLIVLLYNFYYCTGKTVCMIYAIDIVKEITKTESVSYTVILILDGITVFSMYIGCVLCKIMSRRLLLFSTSSVGISFLFIISLYLYLNRFLVTVENKYITTFLLTVYSMGVSTGPLVLCSSISSELIPFKYRTAIVFGLGLYERVLEGTQMKISPYIFASFGAHGAFLFFAVSSTICVLLLYKYLPETKDKTLLEIEMLL